MFKVYDENGKCVFESESSEACEIVCDALADFFESRGYTEWALKCVDNSNNVWYAREW